MSEETWTSINKITIKPYDREQQMNDYGTGDSPYERDKFAQRAADSGTKAVDLDALGARLSAWFEEIVSTTGTEADDIAHIATYPFEVIVAAAVLKHPPGSDEEEEFQGDYLEEAIRAVHAAAYDLHCAKVMPR